MFIILFFLFESFWDTSRKIVLKFNIYLTWFSWDIVDIKTVYLLVCLFVCLFFFHLNHLGIPPWKFIESFIKIRHDLAEILSIKKMFICLSVSVFVCFCLFSFESSLDTTQKIFWKFYKHQTWFSWDIVYLKFCLFFLYLSHLVYPQKYFLIFFVKIGLYLAEIFKIKTFHQPQKLLFEIGL